MRALLKSAAGFPGFRQGPGLTAGAGGSRRRCHPPLGQQVAISAFRLSAGEGRRAHRQRGFHVAVAALRRGC